MYIEEILQHPALQEIEKEIVSVYSGTNSRRRDYTNERSLLQVRKRTINRQVLKYQKWLLPDIVAFNDAMREALRKMYEKSFAVYEANKELNEYMEVKGCCFLSGDYPKLHPLQDEWRSELWTALLDSGWNVLYEQGVSLSPLHLPYHQDDSFDDFIRMNCPPPNWNEGLDVELTKDLHLISAFHHLFDHTDFALPDFIYCRDFYYEINVEIRQEVKQIQLKS